VPGAAVAGCGSDTQGEGSEIAQKAGLCHATCTFGPLLI
jgi:hypothetical protein